MNVALTAILHAAILRASSPNYTSHLPAPIAVYRPLTGGDVVVRSYAEARAAFEQILAGLAKQAKKCSCGRAHSRAEWFGLEYLGPMELDEEHDVELRNCPCGSTIALPVDRSSSEILYDYDDEGPATERSPSWEVA
ncbi:MAG: hypothetical protein JOZ73_11900 [Solirubrobacterales bacterium]|nr:hypothetical protein [Solirubrobacterales bacterium]